MRSDARDFVDDMLDDAIDPSVLKTMQQAAVRLVASQPAAPSGATNVFGLPGAEIPASIAAISPVPLAQTTSGNYVPIAPGSANSSPLTRDAALAGAKISTPLLGGASVPGLETPLSNITSDLSSMVSSITDPRLRQILGSIRAMRVQTQATSEHNALAAQDTFRKNVTQRLARIEARLPSTSALRNQLSLMRSRIIPVMLG